MKRTLLFLLCAAFVLSCAFNAHASEAADQASPADTILSYWWVALLAVLLVTGIAAVFSSAFIVEQKTVVLIKRWGRYNRTADAGLQFKLPFVESKTRPISLRIEQLLVPVDTMTKDNATVKITVAVQHQVTDPVKAHYELSDPEGQMQSYVSNVVRAEVPSKELAAIYTGQDSLGEKIKADLAVKMTSYGLSIIDSPVKGIDPDAKVIEAMNEVVRQQRLRQAAEQEGEANKIRVVKAAEAKKEQDRLHGEGIAQERTAIVEGLRKSVEEFQGAVKGASVEEVMGMVMATQYFDMLKEVGSRSNTNTLFLNHAPGAVNDVRRQIEEGMLVAGRANAATTISPGNALADPKQAKPAPVNGEAHKA